jgi:hypothetical protein
LGKRRRKEKLSKKEVMFIAKSTNENKATSCKEKRDLKKKNSFNVEKNQNDTLCNFEDDLNYIT